MTAGALISSITNIAAGSFKFAPGGNWKRETECRPMYISFTFQIQDNGGTANSGHDDRISRPGS